MQGPAVVHAAKLVHQQSGHPLPRNHVLYTLLARIPVRETLTPSSGQAAQAAAGDDGGGLAAPAERGAGPAPMSSALGHLETVADENFDAIGARVDCLKGNKNGVTAHVKKVRVGEIRGVSKAGQLVASSKVIIISTKPWL